MVGECEVESLAFTLRCYRPSDDTLIWTLPNCRQFVQLVG